MDKAIQLQKDGKDLYPINTKVIRSGDKTTFKYADGTMMNTIKILINYQDYAVGDTTLFNFNFLTEFIKKPDCATHSISITNTHRLLICLNTNLNHINSKGGNLLVTHDGTYSNRNSFVAYIKAYGRWK